MKKENERRTEGDRKRDPRLVVDDDAPLVVARQTDYLGQRRPNACVGAQAFDDDEAPCQRQPQLLPARLFGHHCRLEGRRVLASPVFPGSIGTR